MRRLSFLTAALVVALVAAASAAAHAPTVSTQQFSWGPSTDTWMCGFDVRSEGSVDIIATTFYDSAGTAIRTATRSRASGTYIGPTGLVATYDQAMNSEFEVATGIQAVSGGTTRVAAAGSGMLLLDVGRIVQQWPTEPGTPPEVLSAAGQHPTLGPDAWAPVCAYLAGT